MNFNWPLSSFEPHIKGVCNLIRLSSHSVLDAFILSVSSVSAVGAWRGPGPAPEEPMDDMSVAAPMGYGRSKLVAECLLEEAARMSEVQSACCRVGIVAGPVKSRLGMWNKREYIPSVSCATKSYGKPRVDVGCRSLSRPRSWEPSLRPLSRETLSTGSQLAECRGSSLK